MIKLKDLILERPQSEKSHKTEIMTKLVAPMVAKILKRQNLPVVGTVTSKHGHAEDISDYYWDDDTSEYGFITKRIIIKDIDPDSPSVNEFVVGEI